jgi:phosphopantothenoylcysteine decarboxylase/phosphopantothenate--cysteine ligase
MHCIVTAGPTFEPLDAVRRLTNFSTGRLGTELANHLTSQGHKVTLLIGESATYRGERRGTKVQLFSTTLDLRSQLQALAGRRTGAIFHAAAVSDFGFGRMYAPKPDGTLKKLQASRKISTRAGNLLVELVPTPKIIAELRGWFPRAILCGWKFEANGGRADALRAARRQLADCATDFCVANGPAYGKGFALLGHKVQRHLDSPTRLFAALEKLLH